MFMINFTKSELKQEAIAQCIVKLLFGLAVELDHLYGSRWLIDELYRLGFSISQSEVTRFKQAVMSSQNLDYQQHCCPQKMLSHSTFPIM